MLLAVNIENSEIVVGFIQGRRICRRFNLGVDSARTGDEYSLLLSKASEMNGCCLDGVQGVVLPGGMPGTLNLEANEKVIEAVSKLIKAQITVVGPGIKSGFSIKLDNPAELGADLVANAAGAIEMFGYPVIIADFGTVNAVSVVDSHKNYVGGCLSPGIRMSLNALSTAELLSGVEAEMGVPLIGKNTCSCMRAGVIRGAALAVNGFIREYKREFSLPENTCTVVTGAQAKNILPYLLPGVRHVPDLTLMGLAAINDISRRKHYD